MRFSSVHSPFISISPSVKALIAINAGVYLLLVVILQGLFLDKAYVFYFLGLTPSKVFSDFWLWQAGTYMFIHSPALSHILLNMFALYMFGSELERFWGSRFFLTYYAVCGIGSGLIYLLCSGLALAFNIMQVNPHIPMVGASGAIFGILFAYGLLFGERIIYVMMIFPVKARYFTIFIGLIEFVNLLNTGMGGRISHLSHLAGFASGFLFLQWGKITQKLKRQRIGGFKILKRPR